MRRLFEESVPNPGPGSFPRYQAMDLPIEHSGEATINYSLLQGN